MGGVRDRFEPSAAEQAAWLLLEEHLPVNTERQLSYDDVRALMISLTVRAFNLGVDSERARQRGPMAAQRKDEG